MGVFEQFPYTNFHGVNLDWILNTIRDHETRIATLEGWKVVTDGRLDSLEDRMNTAENDIDALEGRMGTAESDIDALETDIADLEPRVSALEIQTPKSTTAQAGYVLKATGAGTAAWSLEKIFYTVDFENPALTDPTDYVQAYVNGATVYIDVPSPGGSVPSRRMLVRGCKNTNRYKELYFRDAGTLMQSLFNLSGGEYDSPLRIQLDNNTGNITIELFVL